MFNFMLLELWCVICCYVVHMCVVAACGCCVDAGECIAAT
jgi:hypothetical protein